MKVIKSQPESHRHKNMTDTGQNPDVDLISFEKNKKLQSYKATNCRGASRVTPFRLKIIEAVDRSHKFVAGVSQALKMGPNRRKSRFIPNILTIKLKSIKLQCNNCSGKFRVTFFTVQLIKTINRSYKVLLRGPQASKMA